MRLLALLLLLAAAPAAGGEVDVQAPLTLEVPPQSGVVVKAHPRTGRPYVSVVPPGETSAPPSAARQVDRPDYRYLHSRAGQVPYRGPVSDRTKVYVLAGTLASAGVATGVAGLATAPAAAGAAAGSPAVPAAVAIGLLALEGDYVIKTLRETPQDRRFEQASSSRVIEYGPAYRRLRDGAAEGAA